MADIEKCPGCRKPIGNATGESAIFGSWDVSVLCATCWLFEDVMIDREGTNDPKHSDVMKRLVNTYRANMKDFG